MTWIKTIAEREATGELAEAYASIRQQNGSVSNISEAASRPHCTGVLIERRSTERLSVSSSAAMLSR